MTFDIGISKIFLNWHHHNFNLDKTLSIGLSHALKSVVPSRDLIAHRSLIYSLGHFCQVSVQANLWQLLVPKPLNIIYKVTVPFLIAMKSNENLAYSGLQKFWNYYFLMNIYIFDNLLAPQKTYLVSFRLALFARLYLHLSRVIVDKLIGPHVISGDLPVTPDYRLLLNHHKWGEWT